MKLLPILFISTILATSGCYTVPKNASKLSETLSEGIKKNGVQTENLIHALAEIERSILNENWNALYAKAEKRYLSDHNIKEDSLSHDDRRRIAVNSAGVFFGLKAEIDEKEQALKSQARKNTAQLVAINGTIQDYLLSLEKLDAAREDVTKKLSDLTGVDLSDLSGLASRLIAKIN